jgi:hypothetical protein
MDPVKMNSVAMTAALMLTMEDAGRSQNGVGCIAAANKIGMTSTTGTFARGFARATHHPSPERCPPARLPRHRSYPLPCRRRQRCRAPSTNVSVPDTTSNAPSRRGLTPPEDKTSNANSPSAAVDAATHTATSNNPRLIAADFTRFRRSCICLLQCATQQPPSLKISMQQRF